MSSLRCTSTRIGRAIPRVTFSIPYLSAFVRLLLVARLVVILPVVVAVATCVVLSSVSQVFRRNFARRETSSCCKQRESSQKATCDWGKFHHGKKLISCRVSLLTQDETLVQRIDAPWIELEAVSVPLPVQHRAIGQKAHPPNGRSTRRELV